MSQKLDAFKVITASVIKQYGENNVLRIKGGHLTFPIAIRTVPLPLNEAYLVLLEGEEAIERWDTVSEQAKEEKVEVPDSTREPKQQV